VATSKTKQGTFGQALQTYQVFNFKTGLDLKSSPLDLGIKPGQNALIQADGGVYTVTGGVTKRFGITRVTANSVGSQVAITGGIDYRKSDGTKFVAFGTDDGNVYKLVPATGATSTFHTGATNSTRWYFAVYNDKLIFCNRADAPRKTTDGATSAVLGGSPPAAGGPVAVHSNRVFFFDATATKKSDLTWSALNNEEDYTTANNAGSVTISANDGSDLVTMVPSINELVLFKGNRPYRLQGTSPSTYSITNVVPTTGSKGAISTQGAVFAVNDVWFAANNGLLNLRTVLNFGDLKASYASDRISPYWEPDSDTTLGLQHLANSVLCYDAQYNRMYYAVSSGASPGNDIVLVHDLRTNGWSVWKDIAIASMWPVYDDVTGVTHIYAGGYDGHVYKLNDSTSTETIDGHFRHLTALGAPGVQKSPRHGYFYFGEEGDYVVLIDTKFDFGATGGQTYVANLLGGSHTLGVNWVLGTDPLGAKDQIVKRIDMAGVGEFLEVGVRNAEAGQPFTWYGYEILWRPRRAVRPSTAAGAGSGAGFGSAGWGI
jgi:hypothetical protein